MSLKKMMLGSLSKFSFHWNAFITTVGGPRQSVELIHDAERSFLYSLSDLYAQIGRKDRGANAAFSAEVITELNKYTEYDLTCGYLCSVNALKYDENPERMADVKAFVHTFEKVKPLTSLPATVADSGDDEHMKLLLGRLFCMQNSSGSEVGNERTAYEQLASSSSSTAAAEDDTLSNMHPHLLSFLHDRRKTADIFRFIARAYTVFPSLRHANHEAVHCEELINQLLETKNYAAASRIYQVFESRIEPNRIKLILDKLVEASEWVHLGNLICRRDGEPFDEMHRSKVETIVVSALPEIFSAAESGDDIEAFNAIMDITRYLHEEEMHQKACYGHKVQKMKSYLKKGMWKFAAMKANTTELQDMIFDLLVEQEMFIQAREYRESSVGVSERRSPVDPTSISMQEASDSMKYMKLSLPTENIIVVHDLASLRIAFDVLGMDYISEGRPIDHPIFVSAQLEQTDADARNAEKEKRRRESRYVGIDAEWTDWMDAPDTQENESTDGTAKTDDASEGSQRGPGISSTTKTVQKGDEINHSEDNHGTAAEEVDSTNAFHMKRKRRGCTGASILQVATTSHVLIFDYSVLEDTLLNASISTECVNPDEDFTLTCTLFNDILTHIFCSEDIVKVVWDFSKSDVHKLEDAVGGYFGAAIAKRKSILEMTAFVKAVQTASGQDKIIGGKKTGGLSYACEVVLGKPLNKGQQMSDWNHRPLEPAQLTYAALDAHCLLRMLKRCLIWLDDHDEVARIEFPKIHAVRIESGATDVPINISAVTAAPGNEASTNQKEGVSELGKKKPKQVREKIADQVKRLRGVWKDQYIRFK
jgi:hypothetical protein